MYVKVFSQILDSSIAEDYLVRLVFEDFLILADKDGHVDMTAAAIARRTNVPIEIVNRAIEKLSAPDVESRTPDEDGRRIVLLDPHRSWGWRIVNYLHYRGMKDDEARKEYFREQKREQRAKSKGVLDSQGQSKTVHKCPAKSTQAEAEAEASKKHSVPAFVVDEIYLAYPRHKGARAAKKAIEAALKRIAPTHDAEWMLQRVRKYAEERRGQDQTFTPYPQKWFNEGCYEDESLDAAEAERKMWIDAEGNPIQ